MDPADSKFIQDLQREDDVGLVLLGHIHIEHQLIEHIYEVLPFPERCEWPRINYATKVALAHSCGLPERLREPLKKIGRLRNEFAHRLDASLSKENILSLYNSLPEFDREAIKATYHSIERDQFPGPSKLPPRDLLILIFISVRQAVKAAVLTLRGKSK